LHGVKVGLFRQEVRLEELELAGRFGFDIRQVLEFVGIVGVANGAAVGRVSNS
jgi:hypothetical protein